MRFDLTGGVVCLGETMVVLVPAEPGPVRAARTWTRAVGGAESNVAIHLARLGLRSRWVGAVGDDAFGGAVLDFVRGAGVDVSGVRVDPSRPTGLYVKEADAAGSPVRYYRRGSAASALGPDALDRVALDDVRLLHVSGITAALSDSCLDLLREALFRPRRHLVSFDLNWRPALWPGRDPSVLLELADAADVVLAGADEAEAVWGTGDPAKLRALLPRPASLVVKQGERGATLVEGDEFTYQQALRVDVVEPVGAGDGFAAGYLAAHLAGLAPARRLRAGHLQAAASLLTSEDVGEPLPPEVTGPLLDADPPTWAAAHLRRLG
ncbi:sugar kinase [Saccharothrix algeriensis]|uniref:2-dehydro-3-deoxygluconokinase n=1 Tax=Saccharothrix algeriensis TaxID=173560 RepID=A0A8T8HWT8_9PSEU|nr:sugar kinase [Saccharothrix algeriensis]MBM7813806.1 2-dehydro-3-deoxygluconokinase [Saccharothrix algeriensis]QTR02264.1 sugar kinase [Saccharothrix algeriensis]